MNREAREITSLADWLEWRRNDITASRVAALFGAHPYATLDTIVAEMSGQSQGSNAAMRRGRILEPAVIAALAEEHPEWQMAKATTYHRLPDHRLGATPDAFLNDDGLIQCKTVSPAKWEEWQGRAPLAYTLQTLTEMLVTGRTRGVLAVMVCSPRYPVHEFAIERHEGAEARILDAVSQFWLMFDTGFLPEPTPDANALAAMLDDGSHRDLSGDNALPILLHERRVLKEQMSIAQKRLGDIDYEIKNRIGPASTAWLPGWNLSFKRQHRKEHVIPAADIRVLRVKELAEEVE